jgi:DNA-binding CsgD family transcriptional regulator
MSRSSILRLTDFRTAFRLVGECRELGDDPTRWHRHLFVGLARLAAGGIVMGGELVGARSGRASQIGSVDWGWEENGFDRRGWELAMAMLRSDPRMNRLVTFPLYLARTAGDDGACLARTDLIPDREWDRAWDFRAMIAPSGADHSLYCLRSLPGPGGRSVLVIVARALRAPDFSARQKAVVQETLAQICPLVGGPLARFGEPSPADLPPRARRVLRCLLDGDSDKQMVARLGLTRNTVNQHVKVIFAHFGVRSRAELLARWVRRGWGSHFAWADEG